jgi:hypothetical protein
LLFGHRGSGGEPGGVRIRFLHIAGVSIAAAHADRAGGRAPGGRFRLLLRFHVAYSQLLLHAAKIGVTKTPKAAS